MLAIIFTVFLVLVALTFVAALLAAPFILIFKKPQPCPSCDRKVRFIGKTIKCPHCKAKLFKHATGEYMIRN